MKTVYTNELGTIKIIEKNGKYIVKEYSIFNLMGEVIGEFKTLKEAQDFLN